MNTQEFMEAVLPKEGMYCIVGINDGPGTKTSFHATIDEAIDRAVELSDADTNAFFACAVFDDPTIGRKTPNVRALQSIYLDIDCGEAKPYEDQQAGLEALLRFIEATSLPVPTVVSSGYGLHVYWAFPSALTRLEWKPLAERMKGLCKEHGLMIDMAVTADAARILRVPGTYNYKRGNKVEVTVLVDGAPVDPEQFRQVLGVTILLGEAPDYIREDGPSPLMQQLFSDKEKRFSLILERCARDDGCQQLAHIATEQRGLDYNLWRAGLSIARNCVDWDIAIHAISSEDERYDFEATVRKSEDLIDKPYRCETFETLRPGGCKGCPHKGKIKSPIVLGVEIAISEEKVLVEMEDDGTPVEYEMPPLPPPYVRAKSGAIYVQAGDDEAEAELIYEHSLYLVKRMTDSSRGDLTLARVHLPRERAREFIIPLVAMTSKDDLRKVLSSNGVLSAGKALDKLMWYVIHSAKHQQLHMDTEVLHSQMGWTDGDTKFVLGTQEIGVSETRYSPPSETTESVAMLLHPKGALEQWKKVTEPYAAPGAEAFAFAFFTAFGAPLMKFSHYNGALISLVNSQSGTGKTTIMRVVNSVYGHPSKLLSVESDTYAHKIHSMGVRNNLPVTMDEMTNMPNDVASKLAYAVTHGQGPGRMQSQSNMERRNDTTWATIAMCTSNASIVDKLSSGKATANGELMRVIEFKIDSLGSMSKTDAYNLFEMMLMENYGVAGPIYIDYLVKNLADVKRRVADMQEYIDKRAKLINRERYWSATAAMNIVGGQIAHELGLHNIDVDAVLEWVLNRLIPDMRRDIIESVPMIADILGDFLNANMDSVLVIDSNVDNRVSTLGPMATMMPKRQLMVRIEPDAQRLYVSAKEFKKFCTERQVMYKDLLREFKDRGAYMGESMKRMGKGTQLDYPAVRVYEFSFQGNDFFGVESFIAPQ